MPKGQQNSDSPRQRPVSCQSCRARKLRCSRTQPCTNCVSRNISCTWEHPVLPASSATTPSPSTNSDIIERLERIESLLVSQRAETDTHRHCFDGQNSEQAIASQPLPQQTSSSHPYLLLRTCSYEHIAKAQQYVVSDGHRLSRCIWLPRRSEAQILLEKFTSIAHHLPSVTRTTSLPSILEQVYADLDQHREGRPSQIVLLLSIFAAATYAWTESDASLGLFPTPAEANEQTTHWVKVTEDVIHMSHRPVLNWSIEIVQGIIIVGFLVAHVDSLQKSQVLLNIAIFFAQELGLHRIDHPANGAMATSAEAEIGRRIWWYICSSDWNLAARVGSTTEGTYSCHLRQMITKKPLNINDPEIFDGMSRDERPLSQPTSMSFSMQRFRLAEISRKTVDRIPLAMAATYAESDPLSYEAIMNLDAELQEIINDLPGFYSLSQSALMETYGLNQTQADNVAFQGRLTYILAYVQRCKLHFSYLSRSVRNPTYASSRAVCVKHARLIIQSDIWQEGDSHDNMLMQLKLTELLTGIFLACVVLLMDVSTDSHSAQNDELRVEIYQSFNIIDAAKKNGTEQTAKIIDSMVRLLRKHTLPVTMQQQQPTQQPRLMDGDTVIHSKEQRQGEPPMEMTIDMGDEFQYHTSPSHNLSDSFLGHLSTDASFDLPDPAAAMSDDDISSYWNDFTGSFQEGTNKGNFDWENIFKDLDSSFT